MTEIEKMFENAGVEYRLENFDLYPIGQDYKIIFYENEPSKVKEVVKDFTAEKQIELIKLLGKRSSIGLDIFSDNETYFYFDYDGIGFRYRADGENFEEALAHIVNVLWQDLTDQKKEEIRRILNER